MIETGGPAGSSPLFRSFHAPRRRRYAFHPRLLCECLETRILLSGLHAGTDWLTIAAPSAIRDSPFAAAPLTPAKLVIKQSPPTLVAGKTSPHPLTVEVEDASGHLVTSDNSEVILSIESGPAGGTLLGTVTANAVSGVATFASFSLPTAGVYTLTASDGILSPATTKSIAVTASQLAFSAGTVPASVVAGKTLAPALVVQVEDANGNIAAADRSTVKLTILSGPAGGKIAGAFSVKAVGGVATFTHLSFQVAGVYTLKASDGALTAATSSTITVSASQLVFKGQPTKNVAGATLTPAIVVAVEDAAKHVVTGADSTVTLTLASGPSGGSIGGTVSASAVNGIATFSNISLPTAGTYTLSAVDGALASATSKSIVVSASQLAFGAGTVLVTAAVGQKLSAPLLVDVTDAAGNIFVADHSTVKLAILSGPAGGKIVGTVSAKSVHGVATFSNLAFTVAGTYTLEATDGALAPATDSAGVIITSASASGIAISSLSSMSVAPFAEFTLNGSGFTPGTSAISVLLTPEGSSVPLVIPAVAATSSSVEFNVPALTDSSDGQPFAGTVDVQVVQVNGSQVMTSNKITGLQVSAVPATDGTVGLGAITNGYLTAMLDQVNAEETFAAGSSGSPAFLSDLTTLGAALTSLQSGVQTIQADNTQSIALPTTDGQTMTFNAQTLGLLDQLISQYLDQFSTLAQTATPDLSTPATAIAPLDTSSISYTGDPTTDAELNTFIGYGQARAQVGSQAVQLGAKIEMGAYLGVLGGFASTVVAGVSVAGQEAAETFQLLWAATTPVLTNFATYSPTAVLSDSLSSVGGEILNQWSNLSLPVASSVLDAVKLFNDASEIVDKTAVPPATGAAPPAGGLIVAHADAGLPSGTITVTAVQPASSAATATNLVVTGTSATLTFSQAAIPESDAETYSGSVNYATTDTFPNSPGWTPDPYTVSGAGTSTAQLQVQSSLLKAGTFTGTLTLAAFTATDSYPATSDNNLSPPVSVPASTSPDSIPSTVFDFSGVSNGSTISDINISNATDSSYTVTPVFTIVGNTVTLDLTYQGTTTTSTGTIQTTIQFNLTRE